MREIHPFGVFAPKNMQYLLLGSFTAKPTKGYNWFFANGRNQFWPILQEVYKVKADTKTLQQNLFKKLKLGMADLILSCERKHNSNMDINLTNVVFNTRGINNLFKKYEINTIFFSSRFVEKLFNKHFQHIILKYPHVNLITLPSPSPRYAAMSKSEKIRGYKKLLPKL